MQAGVPTKEKIRATSKFETAVCCTVLYCTVPTCCRALPWAVQKYERRRRSWFLLRRGGVTMYVESGIFPLKGRSGRPLSLLRLGAPTVHPTLPLDHWRTNWRKVWYGHPKEFETAPSETQFNSPIRHAFRENLNWAAANQVKNTQLRRPRATGDTMKQNPSKAAYLLHSFQIWIRVHVRAVI